MKNKGIFLVIEGAHGTGKTTLARELKSSLERQGFSVSMSREPYSLGIISIIRKYAKISHFNPYILQFLILADRAIHNEFIKSVLKKFDFVISVRYIQSNLVYQRISGIPLKEIRVMNSRFLQPDFLIILKTDLSQRYKRIPLKSTVRRQHYFLTKEKLPLEQRYYSELCNSLKTKQSACIIDTEKSIIEVANIAHDFIQKQLKKIS